MKFRHLFKRHDDKDLGPIDVVGWGPFFLPGERKRLREAEARRIAEVNAMKDEYDGDGGVDADGEWDNDQ